MIVISHNSRPERIELSVSNGEILITEVGVQDG